MVISDKTYTIPEYEAYAAEHDDKRLELINGRIVEKVTTQEHGKIAVIIVSEIRFFLKQHPDIKGHYAVDASFRAPDDEENEFRPDVSFHRTDEAVSTASAVMRMPDFAVEVKSPTNTYKELREKAQFYLANGSRLVWLVYPMKRIVEVYFADGQSDFFTENDMLTGGDVLPGFEITVRDVFDV